MRNAVLAAAMLTLLVPAWAADLPTPTTTLTAETANNTSAAISFLSQKNGNAAGSNISKVSIRSLLYAGSTTRLFAHVEPWWGSSKHIDIGYSSQDPSQVRRQVIDMISRGLDGAAVDWYGPDSYEALGVKLLLTEAENHPNFTVFVEIDKGAIEWDSCYPTCNATTAVVSLMTRVAGDFFSSPAYARIGGRPLLREFGMETISRPSGQTDPSWNVIDWNAVQSRVPGNPMIVHRNLGGFAKAQSGGAFAWMEPKTLDNEPANYDGTDELNWFYSNAVGSYSNMPAFGAAWKGFNDILADWSPPGGRHIEQNCGQTWLRTFVSINRYYSAGNQLAALQLITWNDYEEGSEVETGIDNCVTVNASASGTKFQWSISGDETTIDHYKLFLSTDGESLAPLGDFAVGSRTVDLSSFSLPAGNYSLFLKAVGKPSLRNQMAGPVALALAPTSGSGATKNVTITATPSSASVTRGQAGQFALNVAQTGASDPVSLSCSNLPAGATCAFAPNSLVPGAQGTSVAMTIATSGMMASLHDLRPPLSPARGTHSPLYAFWLPGALGLVMIPGVIDARLRSSATKALSFRAKRAGRGSGVGMLLMVVLLLSILQLACGGAHVSQSSNAQSPTSQSSTTAASSTSYTITVTATSGTVVRSTNVTLKIQ